MKKINHNIAFLIILFAIIAAIISIFIYCQNNKPCYDFLEEKINFKVKGIQRENKEMVGNDRDIHGCIASAGYTWCEAKEKCIRPWEEKCSLSGSEIIKIDELWNKYINYDLGFEINYPKYSFDAEVEIIEDGDIVYFITDGNYQKEMIEERRGLDDFEKVKGITYAFLVKEAQNEEELEELIKKRYYQSCNLGEMNFNEELNAYYVKVDASEIDFENPNACFMNFAYNILYNKDKNKVVFWNLGQAVNFWYNDEVYDFKINKSFRFLD